MFINKPYYASEGLISFRNRGGDTIQITVHSSAHIGFIAVKQASDIFQKLAWSYWLIDNFYVVSESHPIMNKIWRVAALKYNFDYFALEVLPLFHHTPLPLSYAA